MDCRQLPELGDDLCRLNYCQACDLFPVDMGIDVGPLQARINECKRRYHREVWQILCEGVDTQLGAIVSGQESTVNGKVASWKVEKASRLPITNVGGGRSATRSGVSTAVSKTSADSKTTVGVSSDSYSSALSSTDGTASDHKTSTKTAAPAKEPEPAKESAKAASTVAESAATTKTATTKAPGSDSDSDDDSDSSDFTKDAKKKGAKDDAKKAGKDAKKKPADSDSDSDDSEDSEDSDEDDGMLWGLNDKSAKTKLPNASQQPSPATPASNAKSAPEPAARASPIVSPAAASNAWPASAMRGGRGRRARANQQAPHGGDQAAGVKKKRSVSIDQSAMKKSMRTAAKQRRHSPKATTSTPSVTVAESKETTPLTTSNVSRHTTTAGGEKRGRRRRISAGNRTRDVGGRGRGGGDSGGGGAGRTHTLVFTLTADLAKRQVTTRGGGGAAFHSVADSSAESFVPLLCGDWPQQRLQQLQQLQQQQGSSKTLDATLEATATATVEDSSSLQRHQRPHRRRQGSRCHDVDENDEEESLAPSSITPATAEHVSCSCSRS